MLHSTVKNIITIGASAGGIRAVAKLASTFEENLDAAIFIVIHLPINAMNSIILRQIEKDSKLPCKLPEDGDLIENSTIYLAPADHHLMIEAGKVLVRKGPYENHWRPSIDVLFRTAAAAYGNCVTGIILTGLLDDGTSGMMSIKKAGGTLFVQNPEEAEFSDMPKSVLENMQVDYNVSIHEMAYILADIYTRKACEITPIPKEIALEAGITLRMSSNLDDLKELGDISDFTCPDCGGLLVKIKDESNRYRCYTGHSFTERTLEAEQVKSIEESLWIAIRIMEERKNLLRRMEGPGQPSKKERADHIELHINRLKSMLLDLDNPVQD